MSGSQSMSGLSSNGVFTSGVAALPTPDKNKEEIKNMIESIEFDYSICVHLLTNKNICASIRA